MSASKMLPNAFQQSVKGEDIFLNWIVSDDVGAGLILDGHGPSGLMGCHGMPETKALARELAELIRKVVIDTMTMPLISTGLSACATALLPALQNAVARFLAEKDAELWKTTTTRRVWIGSTMSLVLSHGEEFVSITAGDSPVYELAEGSQVNGIDQTQPTRKEVQTTFPGLLLRCANLVYPNVEGGGSLQRSALACERVPMREQMSREEYEQFVLKMWTLFPWHISEVHRGDFLGASDGIDVFRRSGELAIPLDRLALIAETPWIPLAERLHGRTLPG